jgi:hypothetical protein
MFIAKTYSIVSTLLLASCLSACQPENQTQAPAQSTSVSSGFDAVDAALTQAGLPGNNFPPTSVLGRFSALEMTCKEAGGMLDIINEECDCRNGGLFTTASHVPTCDVPKYLDGVHEIQLDASDILEHDQRAPALTIDTSYMDFSKPGFVDLLQFFNNQEDLMKSGIALPFRLAFLSPTILPVQIDPAKIRKAQTELSAPTDNGDPNGTLGCLYSVALGMPLDQWNGCVDRNPITLYEPEAKFLGHALGVDPIALSAEDSARFSSLDLSKVSVKQAPAILAAYSELHKQPMFNPTTVKTPYESGCATYCVASEPLALGVDFEGSSVTANYEKVYEMGTPSARTIVVRDAKSNAVEGLISLNVEETVSSVTIVDGDSSETKFATYDRYGNSLYSQETNQADPFSFLKQ